jgi:hypothetical protein
MYIVYIHHSITVVAEALNRKDETDCQNETECENKMKLTAKMKLNAKIMLLTICYILCTYCDIIGCGVFLVGEIADNERQ